MDQIKLYVFGFYGTTTNTPFIDKQPLAILPGRQEKLAQLKAGGAKLALVATEGGVAFGYTTEGAATDRVAGIAKQLSMDWYKVSFGHPTPKRGYEEYGLQSHLKMRMPAPGMLQELIELAKVYPWNTMLIGSRDEERDAALNAQCAFCWAKDFFTDFQTLLWSTYQQYCALQKATGDGQLLLKLDPMGGCVGYDGSSNWVSWSDPVQAPHLIEQTRKKWEFAEEERKKRAATVPADDFDPFLDADDLP